METARNFWSNVGAVAYKEASVLRHDKALIGMVLAQPIMMLLLFGFALSNKPANVPWAVLDRSQTALSRRFVEAIRTSGYFLPPHAVGSYGEGRELLKTGRALAFLVVPAGFRRDTERDGAHVQLLLDGSDPLSSARIEAYVGQIAAAFATRPDAPRIVSPASLPGALAVRQRFWFNPTLNDRTFFLTAMAGMLLTNLCLSAMALGLVGERETGTYEQTLALPITPIEIVLGKIIPYVGMSYVLLVVATVAPGLLFGLWPRGSWIVLLLVSLPFVLGSLSAGVFVSAVSHTSAQAVFIAVFFILPSFVLSGVLFPYEFMPDGVRQVGMVFPLRWYQIALRGIVQRGAGLTDVIGPTLALVALFGVFLLATRSRIRARLG